MKQALVQKAKKRKKEKQEVKAKEKVALRAVQKQLQVLKLKEYLIIVSFIFGAALLRVPMQSVPSAEPLTFFAILAGWLFGKKKGFLVGASSLYLSNFFMFGGQGIWTLFQAFGFGAAGFIGGFLGRKSGILSAVIITLIATLVFEITVNIGSILMFPFSIFVLFMTAMPFTLMHLGSNAAFALFLPKVRKIIHKKGGFDEKKLCADIINRIRGSSRLGRILHPRRPANKPGNSNTHYQINREYNY